MNEAVYHELLIESECSVKAVGIPVPQTATGPPPGGGVGIVGPVAVCFLLPHFGHAFVFLKLNLDELGGNLRGSATGQQRGGWGSGRSIHLFAEEILICVCHVWGSVLSNAYMVVGKIRNGSLPRAACDLVRKREVKQ